MSDSRTKVRLGDLITELPKSTLPAAAAEDGGPYLFYCSSSTPKRTSARLQDKPAILMGTGGVASIHFGQGEYSYSTDTWAFRIREQGNLLHEFAYRVLERDLSKIDYAGFEGSGLRHLRKNFIRNYVVHAPDITVQAKACNVLSTIDAAIEKTEALIEKYQQIKAGLMHDLFTRGVLPNGQLRPPREQAPELYQETAIGWIPIDWKVSGLASKGRTGTSWIRTGPFGSSLKGEHWRIFGHPVITIGALGIGQFIDSELLFVGPKDAARLIDFQLKENDVVFSRVADVGRSVVVRKEQSGWIMSSNLMRIAVNETLLRPDYLQMQLASDARVKAQIRASVNSGGRDVANSEVLDRLRFAIPEVVEQDLIIDMSSRLTHCINTETERVRKLQTQKLSLMQDMLTDNDPVKVEFGAPEVASG
jgi:type I restriction enzyme, S subunit